MPSFCTQTAAACSLAVLNTGHW